MKLNVRFRRTSLITITSLSVLVGIGMAYLWPLHVPVNWLLCAPLALLAAKRKSLAAAIALVVVGLFIGLWRGGQIYPGLLTYRQLAEHKVELLVQATDDAVYGDRSQLAFTARNVQLSAQRHQKLPGSIKVKGFGANSVTEGDWVRVTGKLFPTRGSSLASVSFAELSVLKRQTSLFERSRASFSAGMQSALPSTQASLGLGLLLGQKSSLPTHAQTNLQRVGLTHLIAVSGYNLTIIFQMLRRILRGRSKYQTAAASAILIGSFVLVTGFSASIVRAAIVCGLSLLAWYYGRHIKPLVLITLTAAATALWNPLYVWRDIGWYLSFLAFFGVLVLAPTLQKRIWKQKPKLLGSALLESFCAQIMTLPYIAFIFGQVSIISLVANVLVVPLVPLAMLASLVAGIAGVVFPVLAGWLAVPARWLLTYILDISQLLAKPSWALSPFKLTLAVMLTLYVALAFVCLMMWQRSKKARQTTEVVVE